MSATTTTPVVEYADVSWDNQVHVRARFTPGKNTEDVEVIDDFFTIPEEYMTKAQELIGDGLASITTGAELKNSDFGTGASCFVSVKLTCNQDEETLFAAGALAREIATHQATEGLNKADYALEKWLEEQNAKTQEAKTTQPSEVKKEPPAKRVAPKTAGAQRPKPKAQQAKAKPAAASGKTRVASSSTSGNAPKASRLSTGSSRPRPRLQNKR